MGRRLALGFLLMLPLLVGCEKAVRNMYDQPRYKPLTASPLWPDGQSSRPLVPGVVAHSAGVLAASSSGRQAEQALPPAASTVFPLDDRGLSMVNPRAPHSSEAVRANPAPITMDVLRRGRDRYDIYCAPCHSVTGDGDGMVARRGFPRPLSLHADKLRRASDAHLYDVITYGYGVMYPFEDRVAPSDRWAIVAYVRALQLSQHARLADLPAADRGALLEQTR